jgi:ABC-2 type transport system ATP-binding protein
MTQSNTNSAAPAIEARGLVKSYNSSDGTVHAVRGLDLTVAQGEIYALLGPNGAGKTTTIAMLTTLLLPTSGTARVAGHDVVTESAAVRRRIGVTFQEVVLDQDLTGRQVLEFHAHLYGMSKARRIAKIEELAALVELADVLDRKLARYSGGMKRRLELARGLMTEPTILFLDEPTQGLDPQNRAGIWRYVRQLRAEQGITLLLTTHSMDEAEALADRVGIIDHGRLVVEGTPAALVRDMGADVISIRGAGSPNLLISRLDALPYVQQVKHLQAQQHDEGEAPTADDGALHLLQVGVDAGDRRLAEVVSLAAANDFQIRAASVARPSLADVFLAHTGHALRDTLDE